MGYIELPAHRAKNRLTKRQRDVAKYWRENPGAPLDEAAAACGIDVSYLRKWMVDPEFAGYMEDLGRFWRLAARQRHRQACMKAAEQARIAAGLESGRRADRLLEAVDQLVRSADQLLAVEQVERQDPASAWGWAETVKFPGVDPPGGRIVPGSMFGPSSSRSNRDYDVAGNGSEEALAERMREKGLYGHHLGGPDGATVWLPFRTPPEWRGYSDREKDFILGEGDYRDGGRWDGPTGCEEPPPLSDEEARRLLVGY